MTVHRHVRRTAFLVLATAALAAGAQLAAKLPADVDAGSRARLPYLQRKDLDARTQQIYDTLPGRADDGTLRGPLAFAAYNPDVAKALFDLHNAAVEKGTLDPRVRELAILVACRETHYSLEWNSHEALALKSGLSPALIDVVRQNRPLNGIDERDAAVIRFGRELFGDKRVSSATFAKIVALFTRRGAMDMVAVMNTYAVSGFYAIAVDEHMPDGRPELQRAAR